MKLAAHDTCKLEYDDLKFRRKETRYIVFKIDQEQIVLIVLYLEVIDYVGKKEEKWSDFVNTLPEGQYRFAVFDFEFVHEDGRKISKLIFINWIPDSTPLKGKTLYATAKENFKGYLGLNTKDHTITSKDDVRFWLFLVDRSGYDERVVEIVRE